MGDYLVRGLSANGEVRIFAAATRDTVEEARSRHNTSPVVTAALGRLLTAGAMMGSMLQGEDILTLQIRCDGPVQGLTVTADANGGVKGFALEPQVLLPARETDHKLDVGGAVGSGTLQVIKDQGLKEPYIGRTDLVSGEIAEDLTWYFASSEQVPSAVGLGVLMNRNNTVREAGGFIVQLLPGASEQSLSAVERNVAKISSVTDLLKEGKTPEDLVNLVLEGLSPEITEKIPTAFRCGCNREKVSKILLSVGRKELRDMIKEGRDVELRCQFCEEAYSFTPEEIKRLLYTALQSDLKLTELKPPQNDGAGSQTETEQPENCGAGGQTETEQPENDSAGGQTETEQPE